MVAGEVNDPWSAGEAWTATCGHVLIAEITHHDCSLGGARVDVFKPEGRPVFVQVEVDEPAHAHSMSLPALDDVLAVLTEARAAASAALADRGIGS